MLRVEGNPDTIAELLKAVREKAPDRKKERRIRCPQCRWSPRKHDLWVCSFCGCFWNTFDTGGCCPKCHYQWTITACLSCHRWSPHQDWYET